MWGGPQFSDRFDQVDGDSSLGERGERRNSQFEGQDVGLSFEVVVNTLDGNVPQAAGSMDLSILSSYK